jgi:hypothetical protein
MRLKSKEAPSLAKKSAELLPSLRVWQRVVLLLEDLVEKIENHKI